MTPNEAKLRILRLANRLGKFAVPLLPSSIEPSADELALNAALESLQLSEAVRLIDVSYIAAARAFVCRVFVITPSGLDLRERLVRTVKFEQEGVNRGEPGNG